MTMQLQQSLRSQVRHLQPQKVNWHEAFEGVELVNHYVSVILCSGDCWAVLLDQVPPAAAAPIALPTATDVVNKAVPAAMSV
jgi:hypothetical protein